MSGRSGVAKEGLATTPSIGKLVRVPLREVWRHEAYDFTQWLQENIDVLNGVLDLDLVNVEREQAAGSFSIDLVAEDEAGATIVIENQLEKSNHDHLGKLITYLTAMSARAAVWIVAEPRPEHVAAIAWLNESTGADFYLVKVEAIRIGDSPAAPLLTLIVGPSEENTVRSQKAELAERHSARLAWWRRLLARPEARLHAHLAPRSHSWLGVSSGVRGLGLNYAVTQKQSYAELYIDRGKEAEAETKGIFDQLFALRETIDRAVPGHVEWDRLDARRACRIRVTVDGGYRSPEEDWPATHARLCEAMTALNEALQPHLKKLKLGS